MEIKSLFSSSRARVILVVGLVLVMLLVTWGVPAFAITWGEPTNGDYGNVGAFMVRRSDNQLVVPLCSGTLIHERFFLTAAHCTTYADELLAEGRITDVYVSFDFDVSEANLPFVALLDVTAMYTHPSYTDFQDPSNPYDVGMLELAEAVTGVTPAVLPEVNLLDTLKREGVLRSGAANENGWAGPDGAKFTVVGYGGVLAWPPPVITYEDQRRVGESEYVALVPAQLHMDQNRLHDNGGTCFGDSGGPAFWTDDEIGDILVGITSWGDAQCVVTGFDYRVDIPETLDFIEDVIGYLP